jgi:hypothetical protein
MSFRGARERGKATRSGKARAAFYFCAPTVGAAVRQALPRGACAARAGDTRVEPFGRPGAVRAGA